jgi:hypothetical protein
VVSRDRSDFGSTARGTNLREEVNVRFVVLAPLARQVILVVDGFHWTNGLASTAVNTLIRVDVKHAVALINAVDRALVDTCLVLDIHTR